MNINSFYTRIKYFLEILLGFPLTLVSFYFIIKVVIQNKEKVLPIFASLNPRLLLFGFLFFVLYFLLRGILWNKILERRGYRLSLPETIFSFSSAEIKRYIPGKVFSILSRVKNFGDQSVPQSVILTSLFLESIFIVSTLTILSLLSYPIFLDLVKINLLLKNYLPYILVLFGGLIIFLVFILSLIKKRFNQLKFNFADHIDIFFLFILCFVLFGLGEFFTTTSFVYLSPEVLLLLIGLFNASFLIGHISFITPMGLGVREGILTLGLSAFLPVFLAGSISLILRVFLAITEVVSLIFFFLWTKVYRLKAITSKFSIDTHLLIVGLLVIFYIIYFSYVSFEKHLNFFTGMFDLGNMDQTVWNTLHGRIFMLTSELNSVSRLSAHADFILVLLSPFYLIWNDPRMLLLIQTLVLAFGAFFVYFIGRNVLNKNLSLAFAISYLLNPFLQKQNLFDFHAVTLATTFLLGSFFFFIKNRNLLLFIMLVLSVLTKESVYITVAIFGFFMYLGRKKKVGVVIGVLSFAIFYLLVDRAIPYFRGGQHFALEFYSYLGDSLSEILKNIVFRPQLIIPKLISTESMVYLRNLFFPVGFLSFASPLYLVFAVPDLLINLLTNNSNFRSITFHYQAVILPFIYISSIYGAKWLLSLKTGEINIAKSAQEKFLFYYILGFSIFSAWFLSPLPGARNPALEVFTNRLEYRDEVRQFLKTIPEEVSVAATNNLGAHLSHREKIYTIPIGVGEADVIVFLLNDSFAQPSLLEQKRMAQALKNDKNYEVIIELDDFIAIKKKNVTSL